MSDIDQLIAYLNQTTELALRVAQRLEDLERRGMADVEARAGLVSLQAQVSALADSYGAHVHHWNTITDKPADFPPSAHTHAWASVTDKPSTFPPEAHSHDWSVITGKPATFAPATHGNEAHSATFITSASWDQVGSKPATFPPSMHANEAHNPDFVEVGTYSVHTHYVQVNGQWYTTTAPN